MKPKSQPQASDYEAEGKCAPKAKRRRETVSLLHILFMLADGVQILATGAD